MYCRGIKGVCTKCGRVPYMEAPSTAYPIKCKDGKRHWWKSGWACDKCGITFVDYKEFKKKAL